MNKEKGILEKTGIVLKEEDGNYIVKNVQKMTEVLNSIGTRSSTAQGLQDLDFGNY